MIERHVIGSLDRTEICVDLRPHRGTKPTQIFVGWTAVAVIAAVLAGCGSTDPTVSQGAGGAAVVTPAPPGSPTPPSRPATAGPGTATPAAPGSPAWAAPPVRVRIGAIEVDAAVVPVGVEPDGDMEVPGAEDVGWYRFGPAPGDGGSAVLAAHVDYDGRPGAFLRLRELRPGATLEVDLGSGTRRFRVTRTERYPKDRLPGDDLFDRSGPARLALITCGGDFDQTAGSYRDNVVVFADPDR